MTNRKGSSAANATCPGSMAAVCQGASLWDLAICTTSICWFNHDENYENLAKKRFMVFYVTQERISKDGRPVVYATGNPELCKTVKLPNPNKKRSRAKPFSKKLAIRQDKQVSQDFSSESCSGWKSAMFFKFPGHFSARSHGFFSMAPGAPSLDSWNSLKS